MRMTTTNVLCGQLKDIVVKSVSENSKQTNGLLAALLGITFF